MLGACGENSFWYLVKTKFRQERRAKDNLKRQRIDVFCPEVNVEKVKGGKLAVVREILFPGYLFVKLSGTSPSVSAIRSTKGVQSFISFGGALAKVPVSLIIELKSNAKVDGELMISKLPHKGDKLRVSKGSFKGIDVVFSEPDGEKRAIVLVQIMNQEIKTSIKYSDLWLPKR